MQDSYSYYCNFIQMSHMAKQCFLICTKHVTLVVVVLVYLLRGDLQLQSGSVLVSHWGMDTFKLQHPSRTFQKTPQCSRYHLSATTPSRIVLRQGLFQMERQYKFHSGQPKSFHFLHRCSNIALTTDFHLSASIMQ